MASREELQLVADATFCLLGLGVRLDLTHINVDGENLESIVLMLRCTSLWSEYIPGYLDCLKKCALVCDQTNVDKEDILFGLLRDIE